MRCLQNRKGLPRFPLRFCTTEAVNCIAGSGFNWFWQLWNRYKCFGSKWSWHNCVKEENISNRDKTGNMEKWWWNLEQQRSMLGTKDTLSVCGVKPINKTESPFHCVNIVEVTHMDQTDVHRHQYVWHAKLKS